MTIFFLQIIPVPEHHLIEIVDILLTGFVHRSVWGSLTSDFKEESASHEPTVARFLKSGSVSPKEVGGGSGGGGGAVAVEVGEVGERWREFTV